MDLQQGQYVGSSGWVFNMRLVVRRSIVRNMCCACISMSTMLH